MAVGGATTLVSRNPADGDFLSINLISSTDNTLYLNASLKDNHMTFNKSWMANQWTLDHPYGNTIFNRKWRPIIYLSESHSSFEVIQPSNQEGLFRGVQSYRLTNSDQEEKAGENRQGE